MKNLYISLLIIACMSNWLLAQTLIQNNAQLGSSSCPLMEVQMTPSTNMGFYTITYSNHGNTLATNVYVDIELDQNSFIAVSPYPTIYIEGNLYRINLANLQASKTAKFDIKIGTNDLLATPCTKVYIYPNNPCQAMIDRYVDAHFDNTTVGNDGNSGAGIITIHQNGTERTGINLLGTVNSIFEDNVMLNNVPIWDSLLHINNNNNAGQSSANDNTVVNSTQNGKGETGGNDDDSQNPNFSISELFWAEYCEEDNETNPTTTTTTTTTTTISIIDAIDEELVNTGEENPIFSEPTNSNKEANVISEQSNVNLGQKDLTNKISNIAVSVFPNPFNSQTMIKLAGMDYQNTTFVLVDITGKTLQTIQFQSQEILLQKENLSAGIYFYQIVKNEKVEFVGKIVAY